MCSVWRRGGIDKPFDGSLLFLQKCLGVPLKFPSGLRVWVCGQLLECFQVWVKEIEMWKELPCFICWELWRHRNLVIFEDQSLSLSRVCNRVLLDLGEMEKGPADHT
jgi:hypothetical protein